MQNFGRKNFDDSTCVRQIRQTFPLSKFYAIRYEMCWIFQQAYSCICYYFHHKLCSIAICCTCLFSPADLIRTIHNTYRLAMASVLAAAIVNESALLLNGALGSSKLTLKCCLENYCAYAKFSQCHNSNPQSNFTQQPRINFLSCEPIHEIQENLHLGKLTHYVKCEGHYTFDSVHRSTYPYHCWWNG